MSYSPSTRRSVIAWSLSLCFNALLLFLLWQVPALRQRVLEITPKDGEAAAGKDALRKEIEKRIETKRDQVRLDETMKEQILDRLEQEKSHRAVEKVQELKQVFDRMADERERRIEEHLRELAEKPVTDAVEDVQAALLESARRDDLLADRLRDNATKDPATAANKVSQAEQLEETAATAREHATAVDGKPTPELAGILREQAAKSAGIAAAAGGQAPDLTTQARADAAEKASTAVVAAVDQLMAAEAKDLPAGTLAQAEGAPIPELSETTTGIAETGRADTLEDAWKAAAEIEKAIDTTYDQVRAAELAKTAGLDLAEASSCVLPTQTPERENPFGNLRESAPDGKADLSATTAAMNEAERQVGEIASMAANRLALAQGLAPDRELDAGKLFAHTDLQKIAFSNARFSDVSSLMREALDGDGGDGKIDGDKDQDSGPRRADSPPVRRQDRLADGAVANALPGRRFSKGSSRQGWLYLDTWYVIGPWANSDITSFEPAHPPEFEINLDARYGGAVYTAEQAQQDARRGIDRGNTPGQPRQLRWQFTQSDGARLVVPDERGSSTYYTYTDVFFEEAQDMLVAMGTDDSGRLWINGLPVGQDSGLSPWSIDETVRKVHFKRGYNQILVRLENGPKDAELSFLICPPEALR